MVAPAFRSIPMIKIAFIIDTIESPTAGTEKQLLMLIKYLDRSRFAPTLLVLWSSPWLENEFDLCPLEVIYFRSFFSLGSYWHFFKFVRFLGNQKFDCLQTHFIDSNIIGIFAAKFARIPHVISSRRDQGYWHTLGKLFLFKVLNRWVSYFVANCHATSKWASEAEGISLERIKVIFNGAELDQFIPITIDKKRAIRREIKFQDGDIVVGIVANLRPVKRIDIFLSAAALVSAILPKAKFLVVGDGEQRPELERLAGELGISDKTTFLGKRTDVPRILAAFDIAVLSSDSESFSNAIVEYMATGLPVIATDVGGCREMIEDGVNGYVVPPSEPANMAEQIIELVNNSDLAQIGKNNREKALKLCSSVAMVDSFERLYAEGALE